MATLWCSTCGAYHEPQSSAACAREARRSERSMTSERSKTSGPPSVLGSVIRSVVIALLAGFGAGAATKNGAAAIAAFVPVLIVALLVYRQGRRARRP